ncbi:MAG: VanZ family protein [Acidobacteriota bacterium]
MLRFAAPVLAAALSVAYLILGVMPHPPAPVGRVPDTIGHGAAYSVLAAAAAESARTFGAGRTAALIGLGWAFGHGALLEALQASAPPRRAELKDLLADLLGGGLGVALWRAVRRPR